MGVAAAASAWSSFRPLQCVWGPIGVSMVPGQTALMRMPAGGLCTRERR